MSSWVENQQQEAFSLYRRYIGVSLHFKEGSSYDYTLYNGASKVTLKSFLQKPKSEILKFMQLKNKLIGISHEEFLFAQARYDNLYINNLLDSESMAIFKNWQGKYGDKDTFLVSGLEQLRRYTRLNLFDNEETEIVDVVKSLLSNGEDRHLELICWLLQEHPKIGTEVRQAAESNIFQQMMLQKAIKVQRFYSYLCII